MRTISKVLAVAALSLASASSFAALVNWTGAISGGVKYTFYAAYSEDAGQTILVTIPGIACLGNQLRLQDVPFADATAFQDALNATKAAGGTLTITYDNVTMACKISSWTRN